MEKVIEGATKDIGICELKEEQKKGSIFIRGRQRWFYFPADRVWQVEWFRSVTAGFRPYARRCWGDCYMYFTVDGDDDGTTH